MKPTPLKSLIVIMALLSSLICTERTAKACGPFAREAIFSYDKHPDIPLDRFARGELGVLEPSYARSYLYVAYRYMNGMSFNSTEQQALLSLWRDRLAFDWASSVDDGKQAWFDARKKVKSAAPLTEIETYRASGKEEYDSFLNCPADAFQSAARTLNERITRFGAESAEVKDWLQAQDKVFANCGAGEAIPDAAASSSQVIRADRAYQIGAAKFYAMKFDEARADFEKIAGDASSPWHETARYLIARTLIRKASLGEDAKRSETLAAAEAELQRTVAEIKAGPLHDSALKLLGLVRLRLRPEERLRELAHSLTKREVNAELKQELWDYTLLLDKYLGSEEEPADENARKSLPTVTEDELSDWLYTFQEETPASYEHALERWRKTESRAWLVAALSKATGTGAATPSLITAADRIEPRSPAYATASYHVARLLIEAGDRAGARKRLDEILKEGTQFPASALNQFLHLRMLVATSLEEFLKYAQRRPTAFSWGEDGREIPIEEKELTADDELRQLIGRNLFDVDATRVMDEQLPLKLLQQAAMSQTLPEHLRRRVALAAWTRAILLDDAEVAKTLAPVLASLAPEMKPLLDEYANARDAANQKAVALYTLLKFPGTRPFVDAGIGRSTPLSQRDVYRDNWWCARSPYEASPEDDDATDTNKSAPKAVSIQPDFLSTDEAAQGLKERARLLALGTAPNYLAREAVEWANRMPANPRVPEALHLAVMATRYSCVDKDTGPLSRAAWQLLHSRYKQSAWARKTPYWFKGY